MTSWLFAISIISGLLSYSTFNIGFALEKKAIKNITLNREIKNLELLKELLKNKIWLLGFFLTIFSIVLYFVALVWAPLSAIAPLSGFGLVILISFAHIDMKESFDKYEIVGMALIIIGISASSYFTSLSQSETMWTDWVLSVHTIAGLTVIFLSVILSLLLPIVFLLKFKGETSFPFAFCAGLAAGIQTVLIKAITIWFSSSSLTKDIFIALLYIAGFLLTALASTGGLQLAFREGKVTNIMALYNGLLTVIPIFFGGLILSEWDALSTVNQALLGVSIFFVLFGIFFLTMKHRHDSSEISE